VNVVTITSSKGRKREQPASIRRSMDKPRHEPDVCHPSAPRSIDASR
jgi:hypothetical protein